MLFELQAFGKEENHSKNYIFNFGENGHGDFPQELLEFVSLFDSSN